MAWVAVDKDGTECIFDYKPDRFTGNYWWSDDCNYLILPKGSIKKLIGRELTWDDEPVELE